MKRRISIIIPALNEATHLPRVLAAAARGPLSYGRGSDEISAHPSRDREGAAGGDGVEIIVVDGGSSDETASTARAGGARVLLSPAGRAVQMNAGAREAEGDILVFLHADTVLPATFARHVHLLLDTPGVVAGAFRFQLDSASASLRVIETVANWRSRWLQVPYGDQALFLHRDLFHELRGFREIPIMEDFDLIRRLRRWGRIAIAPVPATTAARRWQNVGPWKTTLINQVALAGFLLGVSPLRIANFYHNFYHKNGLDRTKS
ncbi:MAG: TIGR04283 family arsenosugar biosynthesis glycosyltransferase [Acidobacteriota bacterium]